MEKSKLLGIKITQVMIALILALGLASVGFPTQGAYAAPWTTASVTNDFDGVQAQDTLTLNDYIFTGTDFVDNPTNLLLDKNGNSKELVSFSGQNYALTEVEITRYRQKVVVEYYVGDMNSSTYIGTDEGYADYLDAYSDYVMTIAQINDAFGTNISSTGYTIVEHPDSPVSLSSYVEEYAGSDSPAVVKVLVGKEIQTRYNVQAHWYQNKQDIATLNPYGLTRSQVEASSSSFWRVDYISGSFTGSFVAGTRLNLGGYFAPSKTAAYPSGSRTGTLAIKGYFDSVSGFVELTDTTIVIDENTPTTIILGGFYFVDDLGSTLESPKAFGNTLLGSIGIGFTSAKGLSWKTAQTSETLSMNDVNHAAKLAAYPFDAEGDVFNNPEHIFGEDDYACYWPGWMLGHKISLTYTYIVRGSFESNYDVQFVDWDGSLLNSQQVAGGQSAVAPSDPIRSGYTFIGWDTDFSNVTSDLIVTALYNPDPVDPVDPVDPDPDPVDPDPSNPDPGSDLSSGTGNNNDTATLVGAYKGKMLSDTGDGLGSMVGAGLALMAAFAAAGACLARIRRKVT